ncbi:uncharacterized protein LOC124275716 [Haliotis rubra]|uniref:uncharacterized protein LOC124275716 n=1 Tax=Haliotis rubra TaxID=36100 RepID=UPI001EE5E22D|nr:uncharacterized protein LOC124275716 [Haliotis rubra]
MKMLHLLYSFYKGYLQRSMLKGSFESLGVAPVMPTRIGGTRWVGHTVTALQQLWKGYKAFVHHTGQTAGPGSGADSSAQIKAKSLFKLLTQRSLIVYAHFLHDVLNTLSKLSAELQRKDVTIHECHDLTVKGYYCYSGTDERKSKSFC